MTRIFVTVGTQLPFDRMVRTVDQWASERAVEVFAQTGPGEYVPRFVRHEPFVDPPTFEREYRQADLVVAHAGTGSIFSALQLRKPLVIMPRLAKFREHRNDHQLATAERFRGTPGVHIAGDEAELTALLDRLDSLTAPEAGFRAHAQPRLLQALSDFINDTPRPRLRDRLRRTLRGIR